MPEQTQDFLQRILTSSTSSPPAPGMSWSSPNAMIRFGELLEKVQAGVEGFKATDTNPHFHSRFAGLPVVIRTITPFLQEAGMVMSQVPLGGTNEMLVMSTMFVDVKTGEWISWIGTLPLGKADPQGAGSAITYMRRYMLTSLFGLPTVDDDGEDAMPGKSGKVSAATSPAKERTNTGGRRKSPTKPTTKTKTPLLPTAGPSTTPPQNKTSPSSPLLQGGNKDMPQEKVIVPLTAHVPLRPPTGKKPVFNTGA